MCTSVDLWNVEQQSMRVTAQVGSAAIVEDSNFDTSRFLVKYRLVSRSFIKFSTEYSTIAFRITLSWLLPYQGIANAYRRY